MVNGMLYGLALSATERAASALYAALWNFQGRLHSRRKDGGNQFAVGHFRISRCCIRASTSIAFRCEADSRQNRGSHRRWVSQSESHLSARLRRSALFALTNFRPRCSRLQMAFDSGVQRMTTMRKDGFRPLPHLVALGAAGAAVVGVFFGVAFLLLSPPHRRSAEAPIGTGSDFSRRLRSKLPAVTRSAPHWRYQNRNGHLRQQGSCRTPEEELPQTGGAIGPTKSKSDALCTA
jgi:hypothetical protein